MSVTLPLLVVALLGVAPSARDGGVADAAASVAPVELRIVGIDRPVDLDGRTVQAPREVFLEPLGDASTKGLIGASLVVYRLLTVPQFGVVNDAGISRFEEGEATSRTIEVRIAELRVRAVRGRVVVARVLLDGVSTNADKVGEVAPSPEWPAVMRGDLARRPPVVPTPETPAALSEAERRRLEAERRAMERALRPKPKKATLPEWERPVMRWRL